MKEHKLNWRFWFIVILFGGIQPLGYKAVYMLYTNQIFDENNQPLSKGFSLFLCIAISLVLFTYLLTVINLLRIFVKNKGCAFSLTEKGIENSFVIINLFAILLAIPIKCIPWNSIKTLIKTDDCILIRLKLKHCKTSFLGKIILLILGYSFCKGFVKPYIEYNDIEPYINKFSKDIKIIKDDDNSDLEMNNKWTF